MNRELIKRVMADQIDEINYLKSLFLVKREKLDFASGYLDEKIIKVITGIRRCGKSTFCHQLLEGRNYAYMNFDDERLLGLDNNDLDTIFEELIIQYPDPEYIFFDEIQNVDGWELFVNRLHRQGRNIILTGSNSKMLSRELATHLTGRHIQIELFPLSFREYLDLNRENNLSGSNLSTNNIAKIKNLLAEYIASGGFPEIRDISNKPRYLRDLFDKIILRDIVERYKIREAGALRELALLMLNYFSSLLSLNKVANTLMLGSVNTVKEYAAYIEETYLIASVNKFSFKPGEILRSPKKVYSVDSGLISAIGTSLSPDIGRRMENIVFLHERRKGREIFYYNDGKSEIDFVSKNESGQITLIQVSRDITETSTQKREIKAFGNALDKIKTDNMLIITENTEDTIEIDGVIIKIRPLWKYLLDI